MKSARIISCRLLKSLLWEEDGQAFTEYILLLSATMVGVVGITRLAIKALDKGVLNLGLQLQKDLKTGAAPLNVWKN